MDGHEFQKWVAKIAIFLINYKRKPERYNVFPKQHEEQLNISYEVPENGEDFQNIYTDFVEKVFPHLVHWNHPMFYSYFPSPNAYPSILADMLAAAIGGVGFTWRANPALTDMESLMTDWYAKILNLPDPFIYDRSRHRGGGSFQQTATNALYNCVLAARYRVMQRFAKEGQDKCDVCKKFVIYASTDSSTAVTKICSIERILLRLLDPESTTGILFASTVENAVRKDMASGLIPLMVIVNLGSFQKFAFDDIEGIGKFCSKEAFPLWLHVDGSFNGNCLLLKRYQRYRDGLEYADSIIFSQNKWLPVSFDATVLFIKDIQRYQEVFVVTPAYLEHQIEGAIDYRHYGIALSRRNRALKTWLTFRSYGTNGLARQLRKNISYAQKLKKIMESSNHFVIVLHKFTFLNFVVRGSHPQVTKGFYLWLCRTKQICVFPMMLNNIFSIRMNIYYESLKSTDIETTFKFLEENVKGFLREFRSNSTVLIADLEAGKDYAHTDYKRRKSLGRTTFENLIETSEEESHSELSVAQRSRSERRRSSKLE